MTNALLDLAATLDWRNYDVWPFSGPPWRVQAQAYGQGWQAACARLALINLGEGWYGITERTDQAAMDVVDAQMRRAEAAA